MRNAILLFGFVSLLALLFGWTSGVHRSADTIAMLRRVFAVVLLMAGLAAKTRIMRFTFGLAGAFGLASALVFLLPQDPGTDLRLYAKNLLFRNDQIDALQRDISAAKVDVVMLQEISERNAGLKTLLATEFPHQHKCQFTGKIAIAVLSKHPFVSAPKCTQARALAAAQIDLDGRPVWVVSAHIPWPWPFDHAAAEQDAEALLATLQGDIVVAGDFNTFPWSPRLQRIRAMTNTRVAGPTHPTLAYRRMPLPLDHVLAPGGGAVSYRPLLGADHRGLVADISLQ